MNEDDDYNFAAAQLPSFEHKHARTKPRERQADAGVSGTSVVTLQSLQLQLTALQVQMNRVLHYLLVRPEQLLFDRRKAIRATGRAQPPSGASALFGQGHSLRQLWN